MLKSDVLLTHPSILTSTLCGLSGSTIISPDFLLCSQQTRVIIPITARRSCHMNIKKELKNWRPLVTYLCALLMIMTPGQESIILKRRIRGRQREKHKLISRSKWIKCRGIHLNALIIGYTAVTAQRQVISLQFVKRTSQSSRVHTLYKDKLLFFLFSLWELMSIMAPCCEPEAICLKVISHMK